MNRLTQFPPPCSQQWLDRFQLIFPKTLSPRQREIVNQMNFGQRIREQKGVFPMENSAGHYLWVSRVLGGCCIVKFTFFELWRSFHGREAEQVFSLCPAWLERARITEELIRTLFGPNPSRAGRAGCSGPCPGGFGTFPGMETPQPVPGFSHPHVAFQWNVLGFSSSGRTDTGF